MIITSLVANNIFHYPHLELTDLPKEGLIGISHSTPSSHPTPGEVICFALYGRLPTSTDEEHGVGTTTIEFVARDGVNYRLTRTINGFDQQTAALATSDGSDPIAHGPDEVRQSLLVLTGMSYEHYTSSFIFNHHVMDNMVDADAAIQSRIGTTELDRAMGVVRQDMDHKKALLRNKIKEFKVRRQEILDVGVVKNGLVRIRDERVSTEQSKALKHSLSNRMHSAAKECENTLFGVASTLKRLNALQAQQRTAGIVTWLLLIVNIAVWGYLFAGILFPGAAPRAPLMGIIPVAAPPFLLALGAVLAATLIGFQLHLWDLGKKIRRYTEVAIDFASPAETIRLNLTDQTNADMPDTYGGEIPLMIEEVDDTPQQEALTGTLASEELSDPLLDHPKLKEFSGRIPELINYYKHAIGNLGGLLAENKDRLSGQATSLNKQSRNVAKALQTEKTRRRQAKQLLQQIEPIRQQRGALAQQVRMSRCALDLLSGARHQAELKFDEETAKLAGPVLAHLSDKHYNQIRFAGRKNQLEVFSTQKRSYSALTDLPQAHQLDVLLAVQIAAIQAHIVTELHSPQFVVLEDPLAYLDPQCLQRVLKVLKIMNYDVPQVFIPIRRVPNDIPFDTQYHCDTDLAPYPRIIQRR